jgi:hypothetical protein
MRQNYSKIEPYKTGCEEVNLIKLDEVMLAFLVSVLTSGHPDRKSVV